MARVQSSGATGWAVATVLFGACFILCLVLAILFGVKVGGAQDALEKVESNQDQYITRKEIGSDDVKALLQEAAGQEQRGKSVVRILLDKNEKLRVIARSSSSTLEAIVADRKAQYTAAGGLGIDESTPLLTAVTRLTKEYKASQERAHSAEISVQNANQRIVELEKEKAQLADTFQAKVRDVDARLAAMANQLDSYKTASDGRLQVIEGHLKDVRAQTGDRMARLGGTVKERDEQIRTLKRRLADVIGPDRGGGTKALEPDGQIVELTNDPRLLYISLTQRDRILSGMTFEVADENTVIKTDEFGDERGKATVEVVRVGEAASIARIVRRERNVAVREGDQIINVAYSRHAVPEFFVHGTFDLDNTGQSTEGDNKRVQAMITGWGGRVSGDLSYQTDYLVLGDAPDLPPPPGEDSPLADLIRYERLKKIFDEFQELVVKAQSLSIPVLNQNRFVNLVGYYQR